jgi:hypothetical protein
VTLTQEWLDRLRPEAGRYAAQALDNIGREFPSYLTVLLTGPGEFPARPSDRTPVFYGSLDWHSCVEMHWVLVRLLKVAGDAVPATQVRSALDAQLTAGGLRAEAEFMRPRAASSGPTAGPGPSRWRTSSRPGPATGTHPAGRRRWNRWRPP